TLSYFITHEIMHVLVAGELGAGRYSRLPAWKDEGYADRIAKGTDFGYERAVRQLRRGDREMDPIRSGLYLRYHLLVAYLLDREVPERVDCPKGVEPGGLCPRPRHDPGQEARAGDGEGTVPAQRS